MTPDKKIADEAIRRYPVNPFDLTLRTAFIRGGDFAASLTRSEYDEKIKALEGKVEFYREQTGKMREYIERKKIGKPCQPFFEIIMEEVEAFESLKAKIAEQDEQLTNMEAMFSVHRSDFSESQNKPKQKSGSFIMWLFQEGYELCANNKFSKKTESNLGNDRYFFTLDELRKKIPSVKQSLPSLFDTSILDRDAGIENRNIGIEKAISHADQLNDSWQDRAYFMLVSFITDHPGQFMGEDIRTYASKKGLPLPPTNRAWGAILARAKRENIIRQVGTGKVHNPKAHRANAAIWIKI